VVIVAAARGDAETADRGDRRQRFAAKAERGDRFEIVERRDLAGGMALHRQQQFLRGDTTAIVAYPDQAHAAVFKIDVDALRAGIDRVFDQFLDHRRRALDDFAGGDLIDEGVGKLADGHGDEMAWILIFGSIVWNRR
jgi:hypothetical protein